MESFTGITIIGLGPGNIDLLTKQTWELINQIDLIYLRTAQHPAVGGFPKKLKMISFDEDNQKIKDGDQVCEHIVDTILSTALETNAITYAVPGHPLVAESTTPRILQRAKQVGIPTRILEAVSFLEPTFTALEIGRASCRERV